jgi:hypothetical protein
LASKWPVLSSSNWLSIPSITFLTIPKKWDILNALNGCWIPFFCNQ